MMHMADRLDLGMRLNTHRCKTALLGHCGKGRLQSAERLHIGFRTTMLVMIKERQTVYVANGNDRTRKPPLIPRPGGTLLALHRKRVHILAGKTVFGRDQIRRNTLRHEIGGNRDGRISRPCTA